MPRTPDEQRIIDTFVRDGRLMVMPAKRAKRLVVLDHIAQDFEPGVTYDELQVNVKLRSYSDDYAALRRALVDEDMLSRESNRYWRSGGTVDL